MTHALGDRTRVQRQARIGSKQPPGHQGIKALQLRTSSHVVGTTTTTTSLRFWWHSLSATHGFPSPMSLDMNLTYTPSWLPSDSELASESERRGSGAPRCLTRDRGTLVSLSPSSYNKFTKPPCKAWWVEGCREQHRAKIGEGSVSSQKSAVSSQRARVVVAARVAEICL